MGGPERFSPGVGGISSTSPLDGLAFDEVVGVVNVEDGVFLLLVGMVVVVVVFLVFERG